MSISSQVSAKVIAHSKSAVTGKPIITFEWEFPRIILSEVNTHNALSKNAASSRAIPVATINNQVRNQPAMPVRFGKKNSGMQDAGAHDTLVMFRGEEYTAEEMWVYGAHLVSEISEAYDAAGYAKQVCNRWTEVAQRMKQVVTATELNNWFWLRDHHMADPTIEALAKAAKQALDASEPVVLQPGEWHVPYYNDGYWKPASTARTTNGPVVVDVYGHSLEHALSISASCCAQVSYRRLDDTIEKARGVVARLNLQGEEPDQPVHASPLEHMGTPFEYADYESMLVGRFERDLVDWEEGVTHVDRDGQLGSGNLKGWKQYRQLVPNHVRRG